MIEPPETTPPARRSARPLDPRQYLIWHRLRRYGWFTFIIIIGTLLVPIGIVGLQVAFVRVVYGTGFWSWSYILLGIGALAPVCGGAFLWTWTYMQDRYLITLAVRCPTCGYFRYGLSAPRCPECGAGAP